MIAASPIAALAAGLIGSRSAIQMIAQVSRSSLVVNWVVRLECRPRVVVTRNQCALALPDAKQRMDLLGAAVLARLTPICTEGWLRRLGELRRRRRVEQARPAISLRPPFERESHLMTGEVDLGRLVPRAHPSPGLAVT